MSGPVNWARVTAQTQARDSERGFAWLPKRTPSGRWLWLVDTIERSMRSGTVLVMPWQTGRYFSWRTFARLCAAIAGGIATLAAGLTLLAAMFTVALLLDASQAMASTGLAAETVARSPASILALVLAVLIGTALVVIETRNATRTSRRGK